MPEQRPPKGQKTVAQKEPVLTNQGEQLVIRDSNGNVVAKLSSSSIDKANSTGLLELFNILAGKSSRSLLLSGGDAAELGNDESPVQLSSSTSRLTTRSTDKVKGKVKSAIEIDGDACCLTFRGLDSRRLEINGAEGNIWLGGNGVDGDLVLFHKTETDNHNAANAAIHLDSDASKIAINVANKPRVEINGEEGNIWLGGNGVDGDLLIFKKNETNPNKKENATIHLDGENGDIILRNADCAEDFDVVSAETVQPGTVMVLDDNGRLHPGHHAYDTKVAGVVSGAGDYKPGLLLDKQPDTAGRLPIALMGKVFCKVDAQYAPIAVGDLLTTSPTQGCAMKATDPAKAFGAILGKALKPLPEGTGMIPILVSLQ